MTVRVLIVIILRMLTIYLVVGALNQFAVTLPTLIAMAGRMDVEFNLWAFVLTPLLIVLVGVLLWCSTYRLAGFASKGIDVTMGTVTLTNADLYCFAFVFIGIYTVVTYVVPAAENFYKFFVFDLNRPPSDEKNTQFQPCAI